MCEKVQAAIDIVKQSKNLTKGEIVMVFQQVVYDLNKQGKELESQGERMTNMEKRIESLEVKVESGFKRIEDLLMQKKEHGLLYKILLGDNAKYFYFTIMFALAVLAALFGVPASEFKGLIPRIGG